MCVCVCVCVCVMRRLARRLSTPVAPSAPDGTLRIQTQDPAPTLTGWGTRPVPPQSRLGCLFISTLFQLACPEESFSSEILGSTALRANTGMERVNSPLYLIKLLLFTSQTPQRSVAYSKKAALTLTPRFRIGAPPLASHNLYTSVVLSTQPTEF